MSNQYQNDVEVDLRSVFGAVARALPWLILVALVIGAAVFALLSMSDPRYRAETMVFIETGESELTRPVGAAETAALLDEQGIASQVQLIRSRDVALAVIEQLNLAALPEFDPAVQEPSLIDRVTGLIGLGGDDNENQATVTELVLAEFMSRLTVSPVTATRVIAISFVSEDPQLAADVANAVAAQYIAAQREVARSTTAVASEWLQREIEALSARVVEAERNVEDYRAQNDLFRAGGENNITITAQRLADASAELQRVRAQAAEAESKAQLIRASLESGRSLSTLDVLNSALVQRLREQEVLLRSEIAEAAATLLPTHPRLRELNAQLADLESAIREEARNILAGLETEAALARGYETQLAANQRELQIAAAASNQAEVQLRALERVATAERQLLETYLGLAREAVSRQNADYLPVNARIISSAAAPVEPFYPKPIPMAVVGVVITLMLGAAIILVRELASGRATRPTFYQPIQVIPVTAAAPQPAMSPSRMPPRAGAPPASTAMPPVDFAAIEAEASSPALADPEPPIVAGPVEAHGIDGADERQMIAPEFDEAALAAEVEPSLAAIAGEIRQKNARRILITMVEGTAERGRPLAAVALSRALARSGQRILLVDLHADDADRLAMGEPESLPGFAELAAGNASFAQVIFRDRVSAAHFIPSGQGADPEGLINSGRLVTLSAVLDQTYDHVVYDISSEFIPVLGPAAGAIVLVSDVGPSDPRTIAAYAAIRAASTGDVMLLVTETPPEPAPTSGTKEGAAA